MIKTWRQRCEEHPDHNGIVSEQMIQARMQEEIDELRDAIEQPKQNRAKKMRDAGYTRRPTLREFPREDAHPDKAPRQWQRLTADEIWDAWCEQTKPERDTRNFVAAFARAIEIKLQERNT